MRERLTNSGKDQPRPVDDTTTRIVPKTLSYQSQAHLLTPKKAQSVQNFQAAVLALCFFACTICMHCQQWLGAPLYLWDQKSFYDWQAIVKESTALLLLGLNQWRAPSRAMISGDLSVKEQIKKLPNGKVALDFPDRIVLIANHQIYTDWIFLWWSAYIAQHHGHLFIVLKDSLKSIPILGPGMMFFSWIFLSRRWEADRHRLQHRLSRLSSSKVLTPMWLLIFPEGTNLSRGTRGVSQKWATKMGIPDMKHCLLPRTRGLQLCLEELKDTVDWIYDCTIAYEGIPPNEYGQDIFTLKTLYVEGREAPITHLHWRRFSIKDVPLHDAKAFDRWLYERWAEKDRLLEHFQQSQSFPTELVSINVKIELHSSLEVWQILASVFALVAVWIIVKSVYRIVARLF
ncbi:putative acyltransferase [Pyrenochaeta sp. DS3sAY3a]|nr:putative acyltransferase [Pyrenochaeta sp. DS3sAY3a]